MIEVRLTGQRIDSILAIVRDLRAQGYQQGLDFDFAYTPEKLDYNLATAGGVLSPRQTVFNFYDEQLSSWFILKYADFVV
jgi:hypothetical protein